MPSERTLFIHLSAARQMLRRGDHRQDVAVQEALNLGVLIGLGEGEEELPPRLLADHEKQYDEQRERIEKSKQRLADDGLTQVLAEAPMGFGHRNPDAVIRAAVRKGVSGE